MRDRHRLNLDAPFIRAASDAVQSIPSEPAATGFQRPANESAPPIAAQDFGTDKHLRRLPVPQRGQADYSGAAMARYINGLDARLIDHISRHAPRWHAQETGRILARWSAPGAVHPAPSWAPPRNIVSNARDYAGQLVRMRIVARVQRLHDIRLTRTLAEFGGNKPLCVRFQNREPEPSKKIRQTM